MLTRSGHLYLLGESSESGITMDPQQLADAIAAIAQLANLTQTAAQTEDRLGRVETRLENCNEHEGERNRMVPYQERGERDPDSQFLKSIKIDVPTFDGRHDSQLFLIGLNNLTSTSRSTISLSPKKLSLQRWS